MAKWLKEISCWEGNLSLHEQSRYQLANLVGDSAATAISGAIQSARMSRHGFAATVFSLAIHYLLPGADFVWYTLDAFASFSVTVLVFAATYKVVPDVDIDWADVWAGALVAAILFTGGKFVIGFYLGRSGIGSAFGAAASVFVILAWVYYSSQILFLGAEFTKVYSELRRAYVTPVSGAEPVTKEARQRERGEMGAIASDRTKRSA